MSFGSLALFAAGLAAAPLGCGDGPICASEIVVVFASMSNGDDITRDISPDPGIQLDIPVRSNLKQGDSVVLTITDDAGQQVASSELAADMNGDVVFENVNVPPGAITLRAEGSSDDCGSGNDEIQVNVVGQSACELAIREGLIENDYYAPLPVLNASNDSDGNLPNFQANIDITSSPGFDVELFVLDVESGIETSAGVVNAAIEGMASFPLSLAQGRQVLWAECVSSSGRFNDSTGNTTVYVDTEAPACELSNPAAGTTIIPALDLDGDPTNGTQIALTGTAAGNSDVEGEIPIFSIDGVEFEGTALDANGESTYEASFNMINNYELGFHIQDHAGNECAVSRTHGYQTQGCNIMFVGPQTASTVDANGDPNDGFQTEIQVQIDPACAGQTVTTDCGLGTTTTTAAATGNTSIEVTMCAEASCEDSDMCTIGVTNAAGIETSVGATIAVDNQAPNVALQFINPPVSCGGAVAPSADVDGNPANGVQIDVRVVAPLAMTRSIVLTNSAGTSAVGAGVGGDTRITLEPGPNDVIARATDAFGNQGQTLPCDINLLDIVIDFDPSVADGLVGEADGVASAGTLTIDICGTVSEAGSTVDVSIDGGAPQSATVGGTSWCLNGVALNESPPAHTIEVNAAAGTLLGQRTLPLVVDLTPPGTVGGLMATTPTRQSIQLSWLAPGDSGAPVSKYLIKLAKVPLNDTNFDTTGSIIAPPAPMQPGMTQSVLIEQLDAGTMYYVAVTALDPAGNRSVIQSIGPLVPDFDATGDIGPVSPADGDNNLGYKMAHGDFNGDGYSDLAVAAPYKTVGALNGAGAVYVYFGGAGGLGSPVTPDVTINGVVDGGQLGMGLTAIQWGGDAADDLAISAPYAGNYNGRVYIFHGGASFSTITSASNANVVVRGGGGWFNLGFTGWSLATARFDNDSNDDLIIGVPSGGAGNGGVAVLFGGSGETSIVLNDLDPVGSGTARTLVIQDPNTAVAYDFFAYWVFNLGHTEGSSDTDDDIGVSYFDGASAFVIRGRAQPASAGVTLANVNLGADLQVQNSSTGSALYFGSTMGSIEDQNGDNARDVIIGSWGQNSYSGRVVIVDGNAVGIQGLASIAIATITPGPGVRALGTAVVNNATARTAPDVNNDGLEDLLIVGGSNGSPVDVSMFVWYGGSVPAGSATTASADHVITGPAIFSATVVPSGGTPMLAGWAGDVNNDGLEDIFWADNNSNGRDGAFEVLWDDGN